MVPDAAAAAGAAGGATVGAGAGGGASDSPNPVGVEGRGGVCKLLSMGFGAGCGWEGGVDGEGLAGLVTTGGDSCD